MPKITINEVDSILLDAMQRLLNGDETNEENPTIQIDKAKAIADLAKTVIESKKLQFQVLRSYNQDEIPMMTEIINKNQIGGRISD